MRLNNVGGRIVRDFKRPDEQLVNNFKNLPVANLDDQMNRISAIDENIRPVNNTKLLGTAFTVKVPIGDNLMFHKAMDLAHPGDVIVIDAGGDTKRSILGELMITYCRLRGISGIIVDGSIRDVEDLSKLEDFSIYAKGITPDGPYKNGPGEINTPISCGGQIVFPGDIVVGDADGVVFVRPHEAAELIEKTRKHNQNEKNILKIMEQERTYNRPWVDETLDKLEISYLDYWEYSE